MNKEKFPTLISHRYGFRSRKRSFILAGGLLVLVAAFAWQISTRFAASAKSGSPAAAPAATSPATSAAAMQGGGCNNCCGSWSQKSSTGPSARDIHAMAYAQACNRVIMFGGRAAGGVPPHNVTDETWEWDGNAMTWAQFASGAATRPAPRGQHAMAYDAARQQVVLFGGSSSNFTFLGDTWVYSCATHTWTQKFPASSPSARAAHAMAYDPNSQLVVLYGGSSTLSDTWTWDGTNWAQVAGANQPGIRYEHTMAFDGTRVILFGGSKNAGFADNDTWDLTLTSTSVGTWTMIAPNGSGPNKRQRHAMAYDPGCRKVILFGGNSDVASYANDTWEWRRDTLSWCQTSVPTPPSTREFPAMAYDGKGVIMNGGLNSGLSQIQDTWRFACNRPYTYRAGRMDEFALPTDPTFATAAFAANVNSVYSTPPKMDFDEPTTNKFLLHSFTGLPANIVKAELEVRAMPGPGASNDSIHLDFPPFNAPSFTWGQNFFALHPGGTWNSGDGAYTFTLDLCNLPAGGVGQPTNLLGLLNANQSLHVMIQDDSSVDYIKLRVWTCPPRRYFAGLPHVALGQAQLSENANGNLVISNLGASGQDGVNVALNDAEGWSGEYVSSGPMPNGTDMSVALIGSVNGVPDQAVATYRKHIVNNFEESTPDFSSIGTNTHSVAIYNAGSLVTAVNGHQGIAIRIPQTNAVSKVRWYYTKPGGVPWCTQVVDQSVSIEIVGVGTFTGNVIVLGPDNLTATIGPLSAVNLTASGISSLEVSQEFIRKWDRDVRIYGDSSLEPSIGDSLTVTNIGSSGQNGVLINLRKPQSFDISLDTIDAMGTAPIGAFLQINNTVVADVLPPPAPKTEFVNVKRVLPTANGFTQQFEITPGSSQPGVMPFHVVAFNGPTQVADVDNYTGKILTSGWPAAFGRTGPNQPKDTIDFPSGTQLAFNPCPPALCNQQINITQLRVNWVMSPTSPVYITQSELSAADLPEFTLTGIQATPYCTSTITLLPGSLSIARVGQVYNQQLAVSGGVAPYNFTINSGSLNAGLSLNRLTGVISGTPTSTASATFTVTATDDNGCTGSQAYTLTPIVCPTITINPTNSTLNPGQVGSSYSQAFTQSGGAGLPFWTISAGALPGGLTLNSISGLLSGTPTASGTFGFTVQAADGNGCLGTRGYSLTIGCPAITVNPATASNGFVGTTYSQTFTATGGAGPYSFTRVTGTLPPGLTLATGGALTGTPTTAGTFTFTVQATDAAGCTGTQGYTVTISGNGLMFYPLAAPVRFMDTRPGQTACSTPGTPIAGGTSFTLGGAGFCGLPSVARAIMGNVTVVLPPANGFLTVFPSGTMQPTAANTNFIAGDVLNNVFTVGLGAADGAFKIFASTNVDVVVDVTGYFAPPQPAPSTGLFYHPLPVPIRLEDTRVGLTACFTPGAPIPGGVDTTHQGTTTCNGVTIPSAARAIMGNVTVVLPASNGFITVFPGNTTRPLASSGNYRANTVLNSPFMTGLSPTGQFKVYSVATTDVVIDVSGYFSPEAVDVNGTGLLFTPITPTRLQDSRPGLPACFNLGTPLPSGVDVTQAAAGTCNIASTARAIMGNVTVVLPPANGFITFWPSNVPRPLIATSNFQSARNFNRFFTVGLGAADGAFKMYSLATPNIVIDVSGYFAP